MCSHRHHPSPPVPRTFPSSRTEPLSPVNTWLPWPPPAPTVLLPVSVGLTALGTSCTWDHTGFILLCPVYVTQQNIALPDLFDPPRCSDPGRECGAHRGCELAICLLTCFTRPQTVFVCFMWIFWRGFLKKIRGSRKNQLWNGPSPSHALGWSAVGAFVAKCLLFPMCSSQVFTPCSWAECCLGTWGSSYCVCQEKFSLLKRIQMDCSLESMASGRKETSWGSGTRKPHVA